MSRLPANRNEHGYTLQAMIIVAILTAGAVLAFTIVYSILGDSTDNIVGGARSADGLPSPPQNITFSYVKDDDNINGETASVSWEAPSYFGEYILLGYKDIELIPDPGSSPDCDNDLAIDDANFSTSNTCRWRNVVIESDQSYKFQITLIVTNSAADSSRLEIPYSYDLDTTTFIYADETGALQPTEALGNQPAELQVFSTQEAMVVTWRKNPNIAAYRFRIIHDQAALGDPGRNYYLCVPTDADSPETSRPQAGQFEAVLSSTHNIVELPHIKARKQTEAGGRSGYVWNAANFPDDTQMLLELPFVIYESPSSTHPRPGQVYDIELTPVMETTSIAIDGEASQYRLETSYDPARAEYTDTNSDEEEAFCLDADGPDFDSDTDTPNFDAGSAVYFRGSFGTPLAPQFSVASAAIAGINLPQVTITSGPCQDLFPNDGAEHQNTGGELVFTFFWAEASQPQNAKSASFADCQKTLPLAGSSAADSFLIWATATSDGGAGLTSQESLPVAWNRAADPTQPVAPADLQARWTIAPSMADSTMMEYSVQFSWRDQQHSAAADPQANNYYVYKTSADLDICQSQVALPGAYGWAPFSAPQAQYSLGDLADPPEVACLELAPVSDGQQGAVVRFASHPPAVTVVASQNHRASITWRTTDIQHITHFVAALSLAQECDQNNVISTKTIPVDSSRPAEVFAAVFPFSAATDTSEYVCLTAHYDDGSSHTFYQSNALDAATLTSVGRQLLLRVPVSALPARSGDFHLCQDWKLPGEIWQTVRDESRRRITPGSGDTHFVVSRDAAIMNDIYEVRFWTVGDQDLDDQGYCDYAEPGDYVQISHTPSPPPIASAVLELNNMGDAINARVAFDQSELTDAGFPPDTSGDYINLPFALCVHNRATPGTTRVPFSSATSGSTNNQLVAEVINPITLGSMYTVDIWATSADSCAAIVPVTASTATITLPSS